MEEEEEPIESQHMQTLNPQNLGFDNDPNFQNPNPNNAAEETDDDVAVQIIGEEIQSLVLNQAFVEGNSKGDESGNEPVIEKSENGWGDDCYDHDDNGYYFRKENESGNGNGNVNVNVHVNDVGVDNDDEVASWKEGGFYRNNRSEKENGDEVASWKEGGFYQVNRSENVNGDEVASWKEGGFYRGNRGSWKEGGFYRGNRSENVNGDEVASWKGGGFYGKNRSGNVDDVENENGDEVTSWKDERGGFDGNNRKKLSYPLRPDAADCAYYMKTGICKFGLSCKFNHPSRGRNQQWTMERGKQQEGGEERAGQIECKYYLTSGGCKYGNACRYNHYRGMGVSPVLNFNFLGLPIRPGERDCPYYMRTGSCKYGSNCRFHHPDPSTMTGGNPSSGYDYGGSAPVQRASYPTESSWSSPRGLNETAPSPFVPVVYPASQAIPLSPQWNGYQAPSYSTSEKSLPTPPAFSMKDLATKTNLYPRLQQPWVVEEYPERPGQPDCSYFIKTGDCKYKSNCKFHHPKTQISKTNSLVLNDKGLPLRPDQAVCSFYSRYGICKFGPACKFDHPEHYDISPSSAGSDFYQPPFDNPGTTDASRMARKGVVL